MNDSTLLGKPLMNALPGNHLDLAFLKGQNVRYTNYRRRRVNSLPQASSARVFRIFTALGTVTAAIYLVFACATLITKPIWSWKLGRGMASGEGLGAKQDGDGDSSDLCSLGQASDSWPLQLHPNAGALPHRTSEEKYSARPMKSSASQQSYRAQAEENPTPEQQGALKGELRSRKRKRGTNADMEEEESTSMEKKALIDKHYRKSGRSGQQLTSHTKAPSEENELNFWLSSNTEDASPEVPSAESLNTPLASSMSLSSVNMFDTVGGLKPTATSSVTLVDIDLGRVVDDGDTLIWGNWFPEPIEDHRPVSHFAGSLDLTDCEELGCFQQVEEEPNAPLADAGEQQSHRQNSSLTEKGAGHLSAMGQAVPSETKPPSKSEDSAVGAAPGTNLDLEGHPYVRLPNVPAGIRGRQFDLSNAESLAGIRRNPVFALAVLRQVFLKPSLEPMDINILVASTERLVAFALKSMNVSLCMYSRRSLGILGTVFLVVDALYCAVQVLGERAKSELWWPLLVNRIKIAVRSSKQAGTSYKVTYRERQLAQELVSAIDIYAQGFRPPAQRVVYLKRSLLCEPGRTKFSGALWEPWRRDEKMWNGDGIPLTSLEEG